MSALQMKFRKNRMGGLEGVVEKREEDGGCRNRGEESLSKEI